MGQFIVASHVEAYNPARAPFVAGQGKHTLEQVNELIEEAEGDVLAVLLDAGYNTPIPATATQALVQIRSACAKCAAALVEQTAPNSTQARIDNLVKMCDSAKAAIANGALVGVDRSTSLDGPRFPPAASAYFTKDQEF